MHLANGTVHQCVHVYITADTAERDSTTATAISIEDMGEEHGGTEPVITTSISGHMLPVPPPYNQPSVAPPPYSCEQPPVYKT